MYGRHFNLNNRTLSILLCLVLVSIFSLTIAYAVLSVTLNISGNAEIVASSWDIHLDNIKVSYGSVSGNTPSITSPTSASFSTTLTTPGDFYEFSIDVVNDGSIDAMIDSISKTPTLTSTQAKYLKYEISYQNGNSIDSKQLVPKNSFVRLKVRVEFRKDISVSNLPTTSETLNLAFTINYVQSDNSGNSVVDNGAWVVKADGDINAIGTQVTIGSEIFYTIGTEGNNVKLLSQYNITLEDAPLQKSNAEKTPFSSDNQKGSDYTDYKGSIVEIYVNNYKNLLESNFEIIINEARLITYDELIDIGCESNTCTNTSYSWLNRATFWTQTPSDYSGFVERVHNGDISGTKYHVGNMVGVRPAIIMSKDYF